MVWNWDISFACGRFLSPSTLLIHFSILGHTFKTAYIPFLSQFRHFLFTDFFPLYGKFFICSYLSKQFSLYYILFCIFSVC